MTKGRFPPALLHFPVAARFASPRMRPMIGLGYDASRRRKISSASAFPPSTWRQPKIEYRLDVTCVLPSPSQTLTDQSEIRWLPARLSEGMFSSIRDGGAGDNSASDACAMTVFEYAMMAVSSAAIAEGLSALDLIGRLWTDISAACQHLGLRNKEHAALNLRLPRQLPSLVLATIIYAQASHDEACV